MVKKYEYIETFTDVGAKLGYTVKKTRRLSPLVIGALIKKVYSGLRRVVKA